MSDSLSELVRELDDETRVRLATLLRARSTPVAIVGLACRLPGGADPRAFWDLLRRGGDAVGEIPAERWEVDRYYDADRSAPGKMYTRWGGFIAAADRFDADYFGISPREAARMDPQQRLFLEVALEGLEDAGQPPQELAGAAVGVFAGACASDYCIGRFDDAAQLDAYTATGNAHSIIANRVSYALDLRGPSMALDTACSSSLVAVHLACQSLALHESALAIAGGVALMLAPFATIAFSKAQMMAPDGRCKTFDAAADGFVRGEGCGVVVLKRLADAVRDGDRIRAVIHGSAVNQDGRSNGLMAPSGASQRSVIGQALERAGITPDQVSYIEAHGTGTSLGDPIEVEALAEAYSGPGAGGGPCALGSVKTNIGHLEGAAGIAGLLKVVLALENQLVPPNLHFRSLNPNISLEGTRFVIPTAAFPWPASSALRFAGVSSFGFGGTNAHLIVGEAPAQSAPDAPSTAEPHLLALSARTADAAGALAQAYLTRIERDDPDPRDLAFSAGARRGHHEYRVAVVGRTPADLKAGLRAYLAARPDPDVVAGCAAARGRRTLGFVFGGQGTQWSGMGRGLFEREPVFRQAVEACDALFRGHGIACVLRAVRAELSDAELEQTATAQPAIFAVQVGLAALLRAWGIVPAAVAGHSVGEIAAAHAAGVLSLADAVRIVAERSRLMQCLPAHRGKMLSVELSAPAARAAVAAAGVRLDVAAHNGPRSVVLSGDAVAIDALRVRLSADRIGHRELRVAYAFHSWHVEGAAAELTHALASLDLRTGDIPLYSTVTGGRCDSAELHALHWAANVRAPVRLAEAIDAMLDDGVDVLLEVSSHAELGKALVDIAAERGLEPTVAGTLRRGGDERLALLRAASALYAAGVTPNFAALAPDGRYIDVPTYAWQRRRYWTGEHAAPGRRGREEIGESHPLLGRRIGSAARELVFENRLSAAEPAMLGDHRLHGTVVVPAVMYLEMALAAAGRVFPGPCVVSDVLIQEALLLPDGAEKLVTLVLDPVDTRSAAFRIASADPAEPEVWQTHFRGSLAAESDAPAERGGLALLEELRARCTNEVSVAAYYDQMRARGFHYGPAFRAIDRLWRTDTEALGSVRLPADLAQPEAFVLHPALLEGCLQVVGILASATQLSADDIYIPIALESLRLIGRPTARMWSHGRLRPAVALNAETAVADLTLLDESANVVAEVHGLVFKRATRQALERAGASAPSAAPDPTDGWTHGLRWAPAPVAPVRAGRPLEGQGYLICADAAGFGARIAERLVALGADCQVVPRDPALGTRTQLATALNTAGGKRGCIWLCGLDQGGAPGQTPPQAALALSTDLLAGVQQLAARHDSPRLCVVTRGAHDVLGGEDVDPAQTTIWGLAAVAALEHPELWGGMIDIDDLSAVSADRLAEVVCMPAERADRWAVRRGELRRQRLAPERPGAAPEGRLRLRPDAGYLVTGAFGGIGAKLAEWLAARGAGTLILAGRRIDSESARALVARLEACGARVIARALDVADAAAVGDLLDDLQREAPLRGVFHAAGVLDDGVIAEQTPERFARVFAAKVQGAWNLHALTRGARLDHFVLFSSAAALIGSPGQSNYAAANAFLDGLAWHRRAAGVPATTVDWGPWGESGMAAALTGRTARGLDAATSVRIGAEQGFALLERFLLQGRSHAAVLPVDWARFVHGAAALPALVSDLVGPPGAAVGGAPRRPAPAELFAFLERTPSGARREVLEQRLREQIARVLGLASADDVDPGRGFFDLGMDSLMALELKNSLQAGLGRAIPATLLFEYPTIAALAAQLVQEFFAQPAAPVPAAVDDQLLRDVEQMSDEEVESLLRELAS